MTAVMRVACSWMMRAYSALCPRLALLPLDRGHLLVSGVRGTLFSLPELAFVNLRKGSFDYVPRSSLP